MAKLTARQERFCEEYLIDLNATQAAIRAGYSVKTASAQSARLLKNVNIKKEIQNLQQKLTQKVYISQENVVKELANIGFAEISKQIRAGDKIKALELLGRHLGMFTDKLQIEGDIKTVNPFANLSEDELIKLAKNDG